MTDNFLTLDELRQKLSITEPLGQHTAELVGDKAPKFNLEPGSLIGLKAKGGMEVINCGVKVGSSPYILTRDALLEATTLVGLTKAYVEKTPANLIEPHLNYHFSSKEGEVKLLTSPKANVVFAITKGSITPFSNLTLLDRAVAGLVEGLGVSEADVYADVRVAHDLRLTRFRLLAVGGKKTFIDSQEWYLGVQVQNSIVGEKATSIRGYLTPAAGNGQVSTHADSGNWNRRTGGQGDDVYNWASESVASILKDLPHELEAIQQISEEPVKMTLPETIADVFTAYKVPTEVREPIIQRLTEQEPDPLTMFHMMTAISEVAKDSGLAENTVNTLMEIAGDLPLANSERCSSCHRLAI